MATVEMVGVKEVVARVVVRAAVVRAAETVSVVTGGGDAQGVVPRPVSTCAFTTTLAATIATIATAASPPPSSIPYLTVFAAASDSRRGTSRVGESVG